MNFHSFLVHIPISAAALLLLLELFNYISSNKRNINWPMLMLNIQIITLFFLLIIVLWFHPSPEVFPGPQAEIDYRNHQMGAWFLFIVHLIYLLLQIIRQKNKSAGILCLVTSLLVFLLTLYVMHHGHLLVLLWEIKV